MKMLKITILICVLLGLSQQSNSSKDITGSNDARNSVDAVSYEYASNSKHSPERYANMRSPKIVNSLEKAHVYGSSSESLNA